MTVRRGEGWGTVGPAPPGMVRVRSDAELGAIVGAARRDRRPIPPCGLLGGDLMRTVGGSGDPARLEGGEVLAVPVDVVAVEADDGRRSWFAAHLVARRGWWRGRIVAAMNAEFLGRWDVAPRSHPNDGRVDVIDVDRTLGARQRWAARSRLAAGTHLPHPHIAARQAGSITLELDERTPLWLDGVRWGGARRVELTVEADAMTVCV